MSGADVVFAHLQNEVWYYRGHLDSSLPGCFVAAIGTSTVESSPESAGRLDHFEYLIDEVMVDVFIHTRGHGDKVTSNAWFSLNSDTRVSPRRAHWVKGTSADEMHRLVGFLKTEAAHA